jgi:hypothetical protein
VVRLLVTVNIVPSSAIFVTLTIETIRSSETSVLTRAPGRNNPEDGILQISHLLTGLFDVLKAHDIKKM